jgi:hypothetical protein
VQTTPVKITQLVEETIKEQETLMGCKIMINKLSAFQPGYPKPLHRIIN